VELPLGPAYPGGPDDPTREALATSSS
jgi:hypothetical protein